MKIWKVWIVVEEIDEEEDTYEDIGMPVSIGGEFSEERNAFKFAAELSNTVIGD